ncbi:tRNA1(Val) (adenine(37)-N6)-methyltransferase [Spiroplasma endosymbiont of Labia minor]|uniref:tRNA1(Val) (adenine(37)-N6)-methyltransferase n=1 Tax=Spiroplasma endosymbiont of Labia minor TaxID=3066305 RepID=UPI0030CE7FD2
MEILNSVLNYKNLKIYQDTEMFSFTLDSILISRFAKFNSKIKKVLDFGTNNAIIPLIISRYSNAKIVGIEIQKEACIIAQKNVEENNLKDKVNIINESIQDYTEKNLHLFDMVICNPPFFSVKKNSHLTEKSKFLLTARHETKIELEQIVICAQKCLRNGGIFILIHRAERFAEILELMLENKIIPKRIQFVYSKKNKNAKTILIEGILNGNIGMEILPPIIAHNDDDSYTDELKKWFED